MIITEIIEITLSYWYKYAFNKLINHAVSKFFWRPNYQISVDLCYYCYHQNMLQLGNYSCFFYIYITFIKFQRHLT